ncbi:hypothetical protein QMK11_09005 [Campylobacter jejuni]|nr:hypothetical protein QMK15_09190 [Campylobacter jejuni]WHN18266.1 hypothetical protein QMK11_09005 [Campylobacter jejuni]
MVLDGEKILVNKGDVIRVKPEVKRQFFAKSVLNFICVQVKEHSLEQWTKTMEFLMRVFKTKHSLRMFSLARFFR